MKILQKLFFLAFLIPFSVYAQPTINMTVSTTSGCTDGTMTIDLTNGTAPYHYSVYNRNYQYTSGPVSNSHLELTGLPPGDYYVSAYDNDNIYYGSNTNVQIASAFDLSYHTTPVTCNNNGTINVEATGGNAPYTYEWSTGATTPQLNDLSSGVYFLTVTDANGCKAVSDSLYIGQNTFQVYTQTNPYTCTAPGNASVFVYNGSASNYTYYWKTTPVQTTATASGLLPGDYEVIVTDNHGCSNKATASIWTQNAFSLNMTTKDADCEQANGDILVSPSGGTSPYTYNWDNGSTSAHLENLPGNTYYWLTATDANGCKSTSGAYIFKKSPLQVSFTTTPAACQGKGGSATVVPSNGTAPYSYIWYNQSSTSSSISNVRSATYYVQVKDANGCVTTSNINIPELSNCKSTISGTVFYDANNNCIKDNGELGIAYTGVKLSNYTWIYTDANGYYEVDVYPGTYTLSPNLNYNWATTCSDITVNVTTTGSTYSGNNLFISPNTLVSDAGVYMYSVPQRPGFTRPVTLYATNYGTQFENATITYTFSEGWDFSHATPMPDVYDAVSKTLTWYKGSLSPGNYQSISIYMSVPASGSLGEILTANASISIENADENTENNTTYIQTVTTNSYDPNDIQVSPQGTGSEGFISEQLDDLTYRIRFQNTGTDVAYTVIVKSKIDANLEDYTISIIDVSHDVQASIKDDSLFFAFNDINLADSTSNEKESHGYVIYRVNKKSGLAPLTQIFNQADIYFDYNAPVETNRVRNTIASATPNLPGLENQTELLIYPNPCRDHAKLSINIKEASDLSIALYSASGQKINVIDNLSVSQGLQVIDLNLSSFNLQTGLYVAKVIVKDQVYTKSILINK